MPFDFEHRARAELAAAGKLTVGIVGFGTFGQFLARRMVQAGHTVLATSRSPYQQQAAAMGVQFFPDADDFCEAHPDVVILATSILSLEAVLASLPVQRLRRSTLFVDVLSVKEFPKRLLLAALPPQVDLLCTHPMFGPDSGKGSWEGLNFMFERVRVGRGEARRARADALLAFFEGQGCRMVEMACEEHDRLAASTQFLTHTLGRTLGAMGLAHTPIDTKGYQSLLTLVDNTANDSFDLYYGLFMYNQTATLELERLEHAFDSVKKQLFDRLHDKLRAQLFEGAGMPAEMGAAASTEGANGSGGNGSGHNGNGSGSTGGAAAAAAAEVAAAAAAPGQRA
jgi:arogenate dehydrogenase (NADP+)